jgi:hypothetical protein
MNDSLIIKRKFHVKAKERGKKSLVRGEPTPTREQIPRIAKLMALAIHFDELIQTGAVKDQAELARLGRVSRARLTQIMNLLNLASEIQEDILHLSISRKCQTPSERRLRALAGAVCWKKQRNQWCEFR